MAKKPFKVSARTARLIGRENVAHADGAIIELVKNCYDADSKICVVYFDIKHNHIPKKLSSSLYRKYHLETTKDDRFTITIEDRIHSIIELTYYKGESEYILKKKLDKNLLAELEFYFKSKNSLYIIDNGEGMNEEVIDKYWMTIGTDNKLNDVFTKSGRVKAGAKGIGRFALDRLGSVCKMITKPEPNDTIVGYHWNVDWEDFELEGKNIHEVEADFKEITPLDYIHQIKNEISDLKVLNIITKKFTNKGTLLKVSELRDWWTNKDISKLFENLEVLSPPNTKEKFDIYLIDKRSDDNYGKVKNEEFDDFDYKLSAKVLEDKNIEIKIERNEFNVNAIDKNLFKRKRMQSFPFDFPTFRQGHFIKNTSINELLVRHVGTEKELEFERIGEFEFTLYFLKMRASPKDKERFSYRNFVPNYRKEWFDKFGGIKIFRDNFRVRPYGEVGNTSFDWLSLGERKAQSPAGVAKKGGGYKVAPNQIAGSIYISRIDNLKFQDKSGREGFQENQTFNVLKDLLKEIVNELEEDRSTIAREMDLLLRESDEVVDARERANEIIEIDKSDDSESSDGDCFEELNTFKTAYGALYADYDDAKEEIKILRALATTGLMVTSFGHEFRTLRNQMDRRTNNLRKVLTRHLDEEKLSIEVESRNNPFKRIEHFRKYDERLKHWLEFSLAAIRKDKRSSSSINISKYLEEFEDNWSDTLKTRKVELNIEVSDKAVLQLKAFIIDIDSVFNNLLINSFDAFDRKGFSGKRKIDISVLLDYDPLEDVEYMVIEYSDSGPGLSKHITNPYKILKAGFTTKTDANDEAYGTGLGMWIIDSVVDYYNGTIELLRPEKGFKTIIKLPYKV